jgi:hypothetical protein
VTSDRIARDYLKRARLRRRALDTLLQGEGFADVVREAHEVAELVLKGALRFVGVDPPKRHDVRGTVVREIARFPEAWRAELARLADQASALAAERGHAFYGDETALVGASELFGAGEAQKALALVDGLLAFYAVLLGEPSA